MKTSGKVSGITLALACGMATTLNAQNIYVANGNGTIGEYNGTTGNAIDATLVTGLTSPTGMAISGNQLFVVNNGGIGVYNATSGASVAAFGSGSAGLAVSGNDLFAVSGDSIQEYNPSITSAGTQLISGLNNPYGIAITGTNLYVANFGLEGGTGSIGEYSTSGAQLKPNFITGLTGGPYGVAANGDDLFVANFDAGTISEYTFGGSLVKASFITGLAEPGYITIYGSDLFVVNDYNGTVGEYDTTTGDAIDATLITGLTSPTGIAVTAAPEPSTMALAALGAAGLWLRRRR